MDKVKIALTILSIAIVIGPLVGVAYVYRDNLLGLVVPPQVKSLLSGGNSTGSQSQPEFQPPQLVGQPQYNAQTGAVTVSFNFTNPLPNGVSIDKLSAEVQSEEDGVSLGNISINQPIQITPGETSTINVSGILNQNAISQFEAQNPGVNGINISLENLNVDVAGVTVHMDQVNNVGQLQLPG
jgi:LEA14-like dessication related protein